MIITMPNQQCQNIESNYILSNYINSKINYYHTNKNVSIQGTEVETTTSKKEKISNFIWMLTKHIRWENDNVLK